MLSDCFNNYVGLRGFCTDTTPESGLFVNDLPGISLKLLANLTNEEQQGYSDIWDEIYAFTLNKIESDVLISAQKFFKTNIITDNANTGYHTDPYVVSVATNEFKGVTIEVDARTSRYLSIFVNTVQIYVPAPVTDQKIFIFNLMDGNLLDTITFSAVTGINVININKSYITFGQDTKIFVCYNSNDLGNSIDTTVLDNSSLAITRGATIATTGIVILKDNLNFDGNSHGLVANYNLRCDISEFICTSKDSFKFALWWKLGASIMFERMISPRLNKYTLSKTPLEIKELREEYEEEYDKILASIMDNMEANTDHLCFNCRKERTIKYQKP